jgi:hypothetical protein
VESSDALIVFDQSRQAVFEHGFALILIELWQHQGVGKLEAGFGVGVAHEPEGVFLADTGTGADAVKNDLASSPILAEMTCLRLSESRQLVVVLLKERSLRMTDEKENSHCNPALPSNVIPQDVQWRM